MTVRELSADRHDYRQHPYREFGRIRIGFSGFFFLFFLLLFLKAALPLPAQTGGTSSLAVEIGKTENLPQNPAEKYEALLRLARLLQLSGNPERAAAAWLEAANAAPDGRDDRALLEGCRILIALGEYEKAGEGIKAALASGQEKLRAGYTAALFNAFRGDDRLLLRMAGDPVFAAYRSEIYYTLWKISGGGYWKTKLLEEFPQSPEGMIAAGTEGVSPAVTAHWLLFPGREALRAPASQAAAASGGQTPAASPSAASGGQTPAASPSAASGGQTPAASPPAASGGQTPAASTPGAFLQAGLYSREENALSMAERLKKAGFDAGIRRRTVNGAPSWSVSVPSGPDMPGTIRLLKEAGFDSFPVYE